MAVLAKIGTAFEDAFFEKFVFWLVAATETGGLSLRRGTRELISVFLRFYTWPYPGTAQQTVCPLLVPKVPALENRTAQVEG